MGSIDPDDVTHYTGICIKCCACVKKCPVGAKYYDDEGYLYHHKAGGDVSAARGTGGVFIMGFYQNTCKPEGLGGKLMTQIMNSGHHAKLAEWGSLT